MSAALYISAQSRNPNVCRNKPAQHVIGAPSKGESRYGDLTTNSIHLAASFAAPTRGTGGKWVESAAKRWTSVIRQHAGQAARDTARSRMYSDGMCLVRRMWIWGWLGDDESRLTQIIVSSRAVLDLRNPPTRVRTRQCAQ